VGVVLALGCGPSKGEDGDTGSTGGDTTTGDPPQPSVLEQCSAPAPCDPVSRDPGSNGEAVDPDLECAIGQAITTILEGDAAGVTASFCDIGCFGTDLFLVGNGTAYLQAWSTTDVTTYEAIKICTLKDATFFEPCQAQPFDTNACASLSDWVTDCEAIATATCP